MDASNMLKPMLARGELHAIGATTLDEYRKHIEKDAALERRFQPVLVDQPSVEDTISILRGLRERYEVHHGVRITDSALVAAAVLSNRYISERFLPDKAIDLVDEAASRLRMEMDSMPAELDEVDRRRMQLEIEREALKGNATRRRRIASKARAELADSPENSSARRAAGRRKRPDPDSGAEAGKSTNVQQQTEEAERAARLRTGGASLVRPAARAPEGSSRSRKRLSSKEGGQRLLKEEVDDEDIARDRLQVDRRAGHAPPGGRERPS